MRKGGRKLLVATLGLGAISYAACGSSVANLMAPPQDASMDHPADSGTTDAVQDHFSPLDLVANIVAPSP
jgi:hypothetical protein